MFVSDLMTHGASFCAPHQTASHAARVMKYFGVTSLPVVDAQLRPVAMVTDRDLCMAGMRMGRSLEDIEVADAMSSEVHCCKLSDPISVAAAIMEQRRVRRLPVVDYAGELRGVVSASDLARAEEGARATARSRAAHADPAAASQGSGARVDG